jgi:hypothetical protein
MSPPAAASEAPASPPSPSSPKPRRPLLVVAGLSLAVAFGAVALLSRPRAGGPTGSSTAIVRRPGELTPAEDNVAHHSPGSPAAVAESFLRQWFRAHYDEAARLSTGEVRARCQRNLQQMVQLTPELREELRQVQLIGEAAQFDLERAVTTELVADGGPARRRVEGVLHAHGPTPDGRRVASRRAQRLELVLEDGGWKVAVWAPAPGEAAIEVQGDRPR